MSKALFRLVETASADAVNGEFDRSTWQLHGPDIPKQRVAKTDTTRAEMLQGLAGGSIIDKVVVSPTDPAWWLIESFPVEATTTAWHFRTQMPRSFYEGPQIEAGKLGEHTPETVKTNADLGRGDGRV